MDPVGLQDALTEELKGLFKDLRLEDPNGGEKRLNVFAQDLPVMPHVPGGEEGPFPFITVRIQSGEIPEGKGADHMIKTDLVIGIFDSRRERQGVRAVVDIIQRVYDRFATMPVLARRYVAVFPIRWQLLESGAHDYKHHFGSMEMTWQIPAIERRIPHI